MPQTLGAPTGCGLRHSLTLAPPFPRNYVFQRRFVQFNGRSLMYFGSDKVGVQKLLHGAWGDGEGDGEGERGLRDSGWEGGSSWWGCSHCVTDVSIQSSQVSSCTPLLVG